jgi:hypothetical protein
MRRTFALVLLSLLALVLGPLPPAGAASAEWPHQDGSAARRRWNREETALSVSNVARLMQSGGFDEQVNQTPILAGGRLFTVSESYYGADCPVFTDSSLTAATPDGTTNYWNRSFAGYTGGPPAVLNGLVYALTVNDYGCDTTTYVTTVWALKPATGAVVWQRSFPAGAGPYRIAVEDDLLVASGGPHTWFLNAMTGAIRKKASLAADPLGVTIKSGITYLMASGRVRALDKSGSPLGSWTPFSAGPGSIVATSELVYVVDETTIRAVKPLTGVQKFKVSAPPGATFWELAVDNARIYASGSTLSAYDRYTGVRRWVAPLRGQHVVANGVVYVVDDKRVTAVNGATGKELWFDGDDFGFSTAPVVANGRLYVGSANCECSSAYWYLNQYRLA